MLFVSYLSFPLSSSITEWQWTDTSSFGCLLPERRLPSTALATEADVCDQLHGDGQSDRCASHLPALKRTADQSRLSAAATGNKRQTHGTVTIWVHTYLRMETVSVCPCVGHETGSGHACCKDRRRRRLHWSDCHWARERVRTSVVSVMVWLLSALGVASHIPFHHHLLLFVGITAFLLPPWISPPCIHPSWWLTICATPPCCRKAQWRNTGVQLFFLCVWFMLEILEKLGLVLCQIAISRLLFP